MAVTMALAMEVTVTVGEVGEAVAMAIAIVVMATVAEVPAVRAVAVLPVAANVEVSMGNM